jgi:hypothetical protein
VVAASAAAAAPAAQKIRIKLSSFYVPLLTESVDLIKTAAFETGADRGSCVSVCCAAADHVGIRAMPAMLAPGAPPCL